MTSGTTTHDLRPPPARPRGRPADTAAKDHRQAILDAAEQSFACRGYTATTIRGIAGAVGVTPAMVHYYFGTKQALFEEVLDNALAPLADALAELREDKGPALEHIPGPLLRLGLEHPLLPALVVREVMLPGGRMQAHFVEHLAPRLGGAVPGLLAREQAAGRISQDFDPAAAALLVIAMCFFPFLARPLAEQALGVRYDAEGIGHLVDQMQLLLRRGFAP